MTNCWRSLIGSLAIIAASSPFADTTCELEGVEEGMTSDHPICLFYSGTLHFRNGQYLDAASSWESLRRLDDIPNEHIPLRVSSLNNLGYLYFAGLGVETNKGRAVSYWREAVSFGHDESEYHLCYALADPDEPTYEPVTARLHCNKAEAIYSFIKERDEDVEVMLDLIRRYQRSLNDA